MLRPLNQPTVKTLLLCALSGILLSLPYSNGNLWIFAWFGFVPLFFALRGKSKGKAFLLGLFTGIVFWSGTIYWLIHVTLPGLILLVLYLALYFGLFALISSASLVPRPSSFVFFIPSAWILLEYTRSYLFTGFGWALLGYSQYLNLPAIQIADITGAWGVSFLVMMANAAIYSFIAERRKYLIPLLLMAAVVVYGYYRMHQVSNLKLQSPLKVSVIQGNIPQELKWDPDPRAKFFIIDRYITLTEDALRDKPELVIWPEASLPVVLGEEESFYEVIKEFAGENRINLLTGAVRAEDDLYYNSAVLFSEGGRLSEKYDKVHLVPFGEYIPLKKALPFLQAVVPIGEMTPGCNYTVFMREREPFSVLICFEDLFPEISRRFVREGAGFLVNITNDAWYQKTSAPYQHLQASVLRAVENRLFLVRAANTGISAFINPAGRIISLLKDDSGKEIFIQGYKTVEISARRNFFSFYSRYGGIFIFVSGFFVAWGLLMQLRRKKAANFSPSAPCVSPHR